MKTTKQHETILDFVKSNDGAILETIREGTKVGDLMVRKILKDFLTENICRTNDDGGYSFIQPPKKAVESKTDSKKKEAAKPGPALKEKKESDLGPKQVPGSTKTRDNTRYSFQGVDGKMQHGLPKGRLILMMVERYIADHKSATVKQINEAFLAGSVQKRFSVLRPKSEATKFTVNHIPRFFLRDSQLLTVANVGKCAVCSQWDLTGVTKVIAAFKGKYKVTVSK
jgi:hypothetical protein